MQNRGGGRYAYKNRQQPPNNQGGGSGAGNPYRGSYRGNNSYRGGGGNRRTVSFENHNSQDRRNVSVNIRNRRRYNGPGPKLDDPDSQWYRINIPYGTQSTKDFIFTSLNAMCPTPIIPFNYHTEKDSVVFYVQGRDTSEAVKSCSRRITAPNGRKIILMVGQSQLPQTLLDSTTISSIREAMSQRYNAQSKLLNLTSFCNDEGLQKQGLYISLSRTNMLNAVIRIIKDYIPDVVHLSLCENKLQNLEPLRILSENCKLLKGMDLSKNRITNITELDYLKGLDLEELILLHNPVRSAFKETSAYISSMRSRFPKVVKLDGEILSAPIGFDVEEKRILPPSIGSFLPENEGAKEFVLQYLKKYYELYDSEDRQPLLEAYHDQAYFSYSINPNNIRSQTFSNAMIQESRNLLKIRDTSVRNERLRHGKVDIVSHICKLPITKHETDSFIIDIRFIHGGLINVVINGVFREFPKKQPVQMRAFCRTFMIVPNLIINDMFLITNATVEQIQKYGKANNHSQQQRPSAQSSEEMNQMMMPMSNLGVSGEAANTTNPQSYIDKAQLVKRFMSETSMNTSFSLQCLEEHEFDYNGAINVFRELNSRGLIPVEAFT